MESKPNPSFKLIVLKELVQLLVLLILLLVLLLILVAAMFKTVSRASIYFGIGGVIIINVIMITYMSHQRDKPDETTTGNEPEGTLMNTGTIERFINRVIKEKLVRFPAHQLRITTKNYSKIIGRGGFGSVYEGNRIDGIPIAAKLLHDDNNSRICQQFVAEVSIIGTTNHLYLVQLYGFCFERGLVALVYEYMKNGSLARLLFCENQKISKDKLYNIAARTAKGIVYLHEEREQRIIHYDIKPANILLDANFHPKFTDFGLAKLCNREHIHMLFTGFKGTPGYVAPEMWMPSTITHKCDVYSFGMILFEILGGET